ncbi:tRNA (adenosine(37)-N6)-dimethylallyltransferase MiaA [Arenibacter sp. 6A1]|uniref:tRNA (adenosine(37)-N6)-dimethylallyltransferase MiaA n=1 Tax=Arenibacter sp. 6A1 TaxID=2720391 RepID=UPI00144616EC|nr:tRNA (adenosine(37)-N6)-dimethylallyltransferase MiaA [Arenibacter sp. 6A1]NKI25937.1 tRNA (adenosine(37)-N6)-dimethylallyltransferase MiaA [Arenibacter sp. 6A1]
MKEKVLISVVGPTAIGKTKLAIALAQHYKTVIISADSRQFFKEMTIGTAVPSKEELQAAKHYFIQHKSIFEEYSVGDFERDTLELLAELYKTNDIIIMVGGSGLYIDAVVKGLDSFPDVSPSIRAELNKTLETEGIAKLQKLLEELDVDYYQKVDINNPHRLIRALEICLGTGQPYSSFLNKEKEPRPFKTITVGIKAEREIIYDRINQRVDLMMKEGLLDEVKPLLEHQALNALQTVGYRELFRYLNGEIPLEFAISEIKKNTRRFAKRQMTWFNKKTDTIWTTPSEETEDLIVKIDQELI